jgi:hypothetical protein
MKKEILPLQIASRRAILIKSRTAHPYIERNTDPGYILNAHRCSIIGLLEDAALSVGNGRILDENMRRLYWICLVGSASLLRRLRRLLRTILVVGILGWGTVS